MRDRDRETVLRAALRQAVIDSGFPPGHSLAIKNIVSDAAAKLVRVAAKGRSSA